MWFVEVQIWSNGHNPTWINVQVAFLDKIRNKREKKHHQSYVMGDLT